MNSTDNKKLILKEFVFVPLIIVTLIYFIAKMYTINQGFTSNLFFPKPNSMFNISKIIYTSIIVLTLIECFLMFDIPKNLILSRVLSIVIVILCFIGLNILYTYVFKYKSLFIYMIILLVSIYIGQVNVYLINKAKAIKYSLLYSIIIFSLLTITSIYLTYIGISI